jgi:hypothetical protein
MPSAGTTPPEAALAGYNFDKTFRDEKTGGYYRVRVTPTGALNQVLVQAEGRDPKSNETRSIRSYYTNNAIPGPMMSKGNITLSSGVFVHWGSVMSQGRVVLQGSNIYTFFPRKFARLDVVTDPTTPPTPDIPRDIDGPSGTNQKPVGAAKPHDWYSGYDVPDLPELDWETMRSSAAANGTLNCYTTGLNIATLSCPSSGTSFYDSNHAPKSRNNLIWYWDGDVTFNGNTYAAGGSDWTYQTNCKNLGIWGTVIVRGNMIINTGDCIGAAASPPLEPAMPAAGITPPNTIYLEYSDVETSTANYPGDGGVAGSVTAFRFGVDPIPPSTTDGEKTDLGIRGFVFVGGDLTLSSSADIYGALWVNGAVIPSGAANGVNVFYDRTLKVPVLNVVLVRDSWNEVTPTSTAWAP